MSCLFKIFQEIISTLLACTHSPAKACMACMCIKFNMYVRWGREKYKNKKNLKKKRNLINEMNNSVLWYTVRSWMKCVHVGESRFRELKPIQVSVLAIGLTCFAYTTRVLEFASPYAPCHSVLEYYLIPCTIIHWSRTFILGICKSVVVHLSKQWSLSWSTISPSFPRNYVPLLDSCHSNFYFVLSSRYAYFTYLADTHTSHCNRISFIYTNN